MNPKTHPLPPLDRGERTRLPAPPASPPAQGKPSRRFSFYIALSILLLVTGTVWGQSGWHYLTGGLLQGVKNVGNSIHVVGWQGLILHSTDRGDTWNIRESGTSYYLRGIAFPDDQNGWIVGDNDYDSTVVLRTTDGGLNWQIQTLLRKRWGWGICFVDLTHGWICGAIDTVFKTTDGGATWNKIRIFQQNHGTSICFSDTTHGWISIDDGIESIVKTIDGGQTWVLKSTYGAYSIDMLDSLRGWGAGSEIVKTTDGWETRTTQYIAPGDFYEISIGDTLTILAVGYNSNVDKAMIVSTTNGGTLWTMDTSRTRNDYYYSVDGHLQLNNITVVGDGGAILRSTDAGSTWRVIRNVDIKQWGLLNATFYDANLGWATGENGVITHTTNGGTIWKRQVSGVFSYLYGVSFADSQYGKICTDGRGVLGTRNGGNTWAGESTEAASPLWSIDYPDTAFAVAVGGYYGPEPPKTGIRDQRLGIRRQGTNQDWSDSYIQDKPRNDTSWIQDTTNPSLGKAKPWSRIERMKEKGSPTTAYRTITRTTNGGATWLAQNSTGQVPLYGVKFITRGHGWACGDGGTVLHTTDLGATWQSQNTGVTNGLYWITFKDTLHGWACGSGGRILWTTDGGNTWNIGNSGVTQYLWSIAFADTLTGFAVSDNGLIIQSTDGGRNWVPDTSKVYANLTAVCALDSTHVWTVGSFGMVLGWGEAGQTGAEITTEGSRQKAESRLGQSYPNPTRGIASFEYELGKAGKVRVRVYNIAGQAVRTLVEGLEPTGRHVVVWDGKDGSGRKAGSGTYFFQLTVGEKQVIKKGTLIR